uniref:Uncharacterized protein n=1 Tax=Nelumbo nucifera TaxID=4432 RepID=A0A822ZHA0_NELNU|nr:TPA_asm: hypothetical protein HUJ06_002742 [Nelumbo nucifera]
MEYRYRARKEGISHLFTARPCYRKFVLVAKANCIDMDLGGCNLRISGGNGLGGHIMVRTQNRSHLFALCRPSSTCLVFGILLNPDHNFQNRASPPSTFLPPFPTLLLHYFYKNYGCWERSQLGVRSIWGCRIKARKELQVNDFDCEGVDLCWYGNLCIIQIAYSMIEEQE